MGFLQPDIEFGEWVEVETECGTTWIPGDVVGKLPDYDTFARDYASSVDPETESDDVDSAYLAECWPYVRDYVEGRQPYSIETRTGFGVRLSAPGYLDCTEWSVFDTEAEALDHCREFLGVCPQCGKDIDECGAADDNPDYFCDCEF